MPGALELRREDVTHDPLPVDQVGHPAREHTERPGYAVAGAERSVGVADQAEREPVAGGESPMRRVRVGADADHLGTNLAERLVAVAERARLGRAERRVVFGVEEEDDIRLATV